MGLEEIRRRDANFNRARFGNPGEINFSDNEFNHRFIIIGEEYHGLTDWTREACEKAVLEKGYSFLSQIYHYGIDFPESSGPFNGKLTVW